MCVFVCVWHSAVASCIHSCGCWQGAAIHNGGGAITVTASSFSNNRAVLQGCGLVTLCKPNSVVSCRGETVEVVMQCMGEGSGSWSSVVVW